jgi:hypothetical protein
LRDDSFRSSRLRVLLHGVPDLGGVRYDASLADLEVVEGFLLGEEGLVLLAPVEEVEVQVEPAPLFVGAVDLLVHGLLLGGGAAIRRSSVFRDRDLILPCGPGLLNGLVRGGDRERLKLRHRQRDRRVGGEYRHGGGLNPSGAPVPPCIHTPDVANQILVAVRRRGAS